MNPQQIFDPQRMAGLVTGTVSALPQTPQQRQQAGQNVFTYRDNDVVTGATAQANTQQLQNWAQRQYEQRTAAANEAYNQAMQQYQNVNLQIDPSTYDIVVQAPDYYLQSEEFQQQVQPILDSVQGMSLPDVESSELFTPEFREQLQQQANAIGARESVINDYVSSNPDASREDALIYYRNSAAGLETDDNDDVLLTLPRIGADGRVVRPGGMATETLPGLAANTMSVKEFMDAVSGQSDIFRLNLFDEMNNIAQDQSASSASRAAAQGIATFMQEKGLLQASQEAQSRVAEQDFTESLRGTLPGAIAGAAFDVLSPGAASEQESRANELRQLEGAEAISQAQAIPRTALQIGLDLGATGGLVGAARAAGGAALRAGIAGRAGLTGIAAADRVMDVAPALARLQQSGGIGRVVAGTARDTPFNVAFGVQEALTNAINRDTQENILRDFMTDTLISAGTFGLVGAGGRALSAIDTASNARLSQASSEIGRGLGRIGNTISGLPGIKQITRATVNRNAPLTRLVSRARNRGQISDNEFMDVWNAVNTANTRGAGLATQVRNTSPSFQAAAAVNQIMTPEEVRVASNWNAAYQTLQRAEQGSYGNISDNRLEQLRNEVDELSTRMDEISSQAASEGRPFSAQGYRQTLVNFNEDINQFAREQGLTDPEIESLLRQSGALSGDYTRIQYQQEQADQFFRGRKNRFTDRSPETEGLRGPASNLEAVNPLTAANERLNAIAEIAATNRVDRIIVNGIEDGWINGEILVTPGLGARQRELQVLTEDRRRAINPEAQRMVNELSDELPDMREEIINAGGDVTDAQRSFDDTVRKKIDEAASRLIDNTTLRQQIDNYAQETGTTERQVAYEMLGSARQSINNSVDSSFARTKFDASEQDDLKSAIKNAISDEIDKAVAQSGRLAETNDIVDELKQINRTIRESDTDSAFARPYYVGGQKGYYEVTDPDLADMMQKQNTPTETGMMQRFLQNSSNVLRAGATALNPAFNYLVSPIRDSLQSTVLSGTGFLNPQYTRRTLLETAANGNQETVDAWERALQPILNTGTFQDMARGQEQASRAARTDFGQRRIDASEERRRQAKLGRALAGWGNDRGSYKEAALNTGRVLRNPIQALRSGDLLKQADELMTIPELRMRERVYTTRLQQAKERGLSDAEAQTEALFYTTNAMTMFSNMGERVQTLVRTIPYLNAGIQGVASFNRLWQLDPLGVGARLFGGAMMPAAYLTAWNLSDPERRETYYNVPRYEREMNFIVVLDGGAILKIPMAHELAALVNPMRETIEAMNGLGDQDFMGSVLRGLSIASPVDVSGFIGSDDFGDEGSLTRGMQRFVSGLLPPPVSGSVSVISGENPFTGTPIGPTEQELIERGQVSPGEEITAGDITFASRDSQTLRALADATGIPQANIQSFFQSTTGEVGQMVLRGIDQLFGAPEDKQGGRAFEDSFARRIFDDSPNNIQVTFQRGISDLERRRDELQTRLERISRDDYSNRDDQTRLVEQSEMRDTLINEYAQEVAAFSDQFGEYYQSVGGLGASQKRRIANLMNITPDIRGTVDQTPAAQAVAEQAFWDARDSATQRGIDAGLQPFDDRQIFGRLRRGETGTGSRVDMENTTFLNQAIRNRVYGAPRNAVAEFNDIIKADRENGIESLRSVRERFYDRINDIYDRGELTDVDFDTIEALQREYMQQFDARIQPLLEKYGTSILNNNDVVNELRGFVMIPRSDWAEGVRTSRSGRQFTQYISSRVFPNAGPDVKEILQQRYQIQDVALPSDDVVSERIQEINNRINSGRVGSAMAAARSLDNLIQQGSVYASPYDMDQLSEILR